MSLATTILDHLAATAGAHSSTEVAAALGESTKRVSDALGKLAKVGKVTKEDGKFSALEDLIGEPEPMDTAPRTEAEEASDAELPTAGDKTVDLAAWRGKIAKLLAKAERTDNDHERDTFLAAAERLMLRLGIHRAELEAVGQVKREEIVEAKREWNGNYSIVMVPFVYDVARGFGGLEVLQSTRNAMRRTTYIVGPKSQVDEFCRLVDSLNLQAFSALKRWQKTNVAERRGLSDMEKFIIHRSYLAGFGQQVGRRLTKARTQEEASATPGAAVVLADRQVEVRAWLDEKYGTLGKARGGMKYGSSLAREAGQEAGAKAVLHDKSVGAGRKAVATK